jgi:hypothetical protein
MKSVPSLLFFGPMKEEPHAGIRKSPFVKSGIEDGHGRELKPPYRPGEQCLDKSTGKVVTILSCEPVRIEDISEDDIIKAGLADGSCEWANGAARCNAKGDLVVNQFMDKWKHGKWAWRIESQPFGIAE